MSTAAGSRPHSLSPTGLLVVGWAAAIVATIVFFSLAWEVATYAPIVVVDTKIAGWLHHHGTPELTAFMIAVSGLHSILGTSLIAAAFGLVLARLREWYWLLTLALTMVGGFLLNVLLKTVYARIRPYFDDPWVSLSTYSFPSGHTAGATLFYGVLAAFLVSRFAGTRERITCIVGATLAVLLVAFSRMYLGAHYFSDVLAAACSSLVWVVLCLSWVHSRVRRSMGLKPRRIEINVWQWVMPMLLVATVVVAASYFPVQQWADHFEDKLDGMGLVTGMLLFCAVSVVANLVFAPAWIFQVAAGAAFGMMWGLLAASVSALLSAVIAFLIARYLARGRIEKMLRGHPKFKEFDKAASRDGWKVVALLRLSPLFSSALKSYFFGLTKVPLATYAAASLAGMLPGLTLKVYIGAAGRDALRGGPLEWALVGAGILATIALGLVIRHLTRTRR